MQQRAGALLETVTFLLAIGYISGESGGLPWEKKSLAGRF
jgi:hypothetical protein